jgi:hypothetical protein
MTGACSRGKLQQKVNLPLPGAKRQETAPRTEINPGDGPVVVIGYQAAQYGSFHHECRGCEQDECFCFHHQSQRSPAGSGGCPEYFSSFYIFENSRGNRYKIFFFKIAATTFSVLHLLPN